MRYFLTNKGCTCSNALVRATSIVYQGVALQVHPKPSYVNTCMHIIVVRREEMHLHFDAGLGKFSNVVSNQTMISMNSAVEK